MWYNSKQSIIFMYIFILEFFKYVQNSNSLDRKVIVPGATGYIGRAVVQELVSKGIPTIALVRSLDIPEKTAKCLAGSSIIKCDVSNENELHEIYRKYLPTSTICCIASRSGIKKDSWAVDYGVGKNTLFAQESIATSHYKDKITCSYVLLSAFCVGKPLLQFQFAKLKLEEEIRKLSTITHSIVRPTAFFKSLDGQIESVQKGLPILYFGDGTCAANAICEKDLANFLIKCALNPEEVDMINKSRDIGGPDNPPITKKQQIDLIYETLNIPEDKRISISLPIAIFDILINLFSLLEKTFEKIGSEKLKSRFEDATEIARIVRYYATEPMVAVGPNEIVGNTKLIDHFKSIAKKGGKLDEIDKMTTTTGVLEIFSKNEYV